MQRGGWGGVLFYVAVREMRAWGRESLFVLFLGLVHGSIIKFAAVCLLALIMWGRIGGRQITLFIYLLVTVCINSYLHVVFISCMTLQFAT